MPVKVVKNDTQMKRGYDTIPNILLRGAMNDVSSTAFQVYMYLHSHSFDYDPTQETVAKNLGLSIAKVQRAYRELREHGYLDIVSRGVGQKQVYFVHEKPLNKKKKSSNNEPSC